MAEADRFIDPETIIRRTIQYGLDHYPELSKEQQYDRMMQHLHEKYGRNGYLKLWFPNSPNATRLERLHQMIDNKEEIKSIFEKYLSSCSCTY
ncbi:MAG: hypothetical protein J5708_06870 [Bacteroidales bacterium]|nr:hypothetical protein [Bacteroidales bacterium]